MRQLPRIKHLANAYFLTHRVHYLCVFSLFRQPHRVLSAVVRLHDVSPSLSGPDMNGGLCLTDGLFPSPTLGSIVWKPLLCWIDLSSLVL